MDNQISLGFLGFFLHGVQNLSHHLCCKKARFLFVRIIRLLLLSDELTLEDFLEVFCKRMEFSECRVVFVSLGLIFHEFKKVHWAEGLDCPYEV